MGEVVEDLARRVLGRLPIEERTEDVAEQVDEAERDRGRPDEDVALVRDRDPRQAGALLGLAEGPLETLLGLPKQLREGRSGVNGLWKVWGVDRVHTSSLTSPLGPCASRGPAEPWTRAWLGRIRRLERADHFRGDRLDQAYELNGDRAGGLHDLLVSQGLG